MGTIISFAVEMAVFMMYYKNGFWEKGLMDKSIPMYLLLYIARPSGINSMASLICTLASLSEKISEKVRIYISCYAVLICCAGISIFHVYFSFIMFSMAFPIFVCVMFADRKLLNIISLSTIVSFAMASFEFNQVRVDLDPSHKIISIVVLAALLFVSYVMAGSLAHSQEVQIQFIYDNYMKQARLIEELKIEPMTQLYNKTALEGCLLSYVKKFADGSLHPTIAIIDIDHFKLVNDTYGHASGDVVLLALSKIIKEKMGGIRHAFRFGGEEFVLAFENESLDFVRDKVQAIKDEFCASTFDFAKGKHFSFSAGISVLKENLSKEEWFNSMDSALYSAKETGRNKIVVAEH